jgi:hypothetical protein
MTITISAILMMRTHDLQIDESHAQRLPRLQLSAPGRTPKPRLSRPRHPSWPSSMQVETDDVQSQTPWSTFMEKKQHDWTRQLLWTMSTTILRELLRAPPLRGSRYQLLNIKNGLFKAFLSERTSEMKRRITSSSSCPLSWNTSTHPSILKRWTLARVGCRQHKPPSLTRASHIPRSIQQCQCLGRRASYSRQRKMEAY